MPFGYPAWPADAPHYHNACTDPCDVWQGHCCCGAYHEEGEFFLDKTGNLLRYGQVVVSAAADTPNESENALFGGRLGSITWGFNTEAKKMHMPIDWSICNAIWLGMTIAWIVQKIILWACSVIGGMRTG